ncbi:MAG: hypothetical protein FE042_05360, partial [Thermoplasmata archaeon]
MNDLATDLANAISKELGIPQYMGEIIVSILIFLMAIIIGWTVYIIFERYIKRLAEKTKTKL